MFDIRYIIIYVTIFGMEICWLYAALNAANKSVSDVLSVPLLLVTLLLSFIVSRSLRLIHWPKLFLTIISWLAWPVIMLLMIKIQLFRNYSFQDTVWLASIPHAFAKIFYQFEPALLILISTGILWWLGRRLAYARAEFATSISETQFGLVILVLVFFTAYELNLDQSSSVPLALAFFSLGLCSLAVSHSQSNRWFSSLREGNWSAILIFTIGIILISGLIISIIFTPELIQLFIKALKWIWDVINRILTFIASLFPEQAPATLPPAASVPANTPQDTPIIVFPECLRPGFALAWEIMISGFILLVIWRISSQIFGWIRRQVGISGGQVESLRGAFKLDLVNFFKNLLSKIFRIKFGSANKNVKNISPDIASVRQLYVELLRWGSKAGITRKPNQTPEEYRQSLDPALRQNRDDLAFITQKYTYARYGAASPSGIELNNLKQKWHNLKKTGLKTT